MTFRPTRTGLTTLLGFGHRDDWQPAVETNRWKTWLAHKRRCALVVGCNPRGDWSQRELQTLLADALEWARKRQARLLVVTTQQSASAGPWLQQHAGDDAEVYAWQPDDNENPYSVAVEHAGALLIAGGTPGVLHDALSSQKPVYLAPWLERSGFRKSFASRVAQRAFRPSYNKRGSIRPQQGLTYFCARLIERGWVLPPRGLADWQRLLVERGLAAWIGSSAIPSRRHEPELPALCDRIMRRLEAEAHVGSPADQGTARR